MKSARLSHFLFLSFVVAALLSCGGSGKSKKAKGGDYPLQFEAKVGGPFSESIEISNAVLKIDESFLSGKLLVEVKRTTAALPLDPNDAQVCGIGKGSTYEWCMTADILGESNLPVATNLNKYGYEPFEKMLSLKVGEAVWLEFSLGLGGTDLSKDPSKAKKVKLSSSMEKRTISGSGDASSSSEKASDASDGGSDVDMEDIDKLQKATDKAIDQMERIKKIQDGN